MRVLLCAIALGITASLAAAQVGPTERMEVTVYNQDLGVVKDVRSIELTEGRSSIQFADVAARIDPTSVHFKSLTDPAGVEILEQNYQFDLVDRTKLLEKYLGKEIRIVRYGRDGRPVETQTGVLLGAEGGRPGVVRIGDQVVMDPDGTTVLPALPEGLITKPTLVWDLAAAKGGKHQVEVSYMTSGLTWSADYVAVVSPDDTKADLNAWVTLTNTSGARYPDARLKLVAGDVRRVQPEPKGDVAGRYAGEAAWDFETELFVEKAFFEYHLYTLQRSTTIADNETKQVALLNAPGVAVRKLYVFDPAQAPAVPSEREGADLRKVGVRLEMDNKEASGLGMPLPKGRVRVYKADADDSLQFVGEDLIDHTPKDEKVSLRVGDAFDLVGGRQVLDHRALGPRAQQERIRIVLRNHKEAETVSITVVEHLQGDWTIGAANVPFVKKDAQTAEFTVPVPPGEEVAIGFTVTTRW